MSRVEQTPADASAVNHPASACMEYYKQCSPVSRYDLRLLGTDLPTTVARASQAWLVAMPVAAAQLVLSTASVDHVLVGAGGFAAKLPMAATGVLPHYEIWKFYQGPSSVHASHLQNPVRYLFMPQQSCAGALPLRSCLVSWGALQHDCEGPLVCESSRSQDVGVGFVKHQQPVREQSVVS